MWQWKAFHDCQTSLMISHQEHDALYEPLDQSDGCSSLGYVELLCVLQLPNQALFAHKIYHIARDIFLLNA